MGDFDTSEVHDFADELAAAGPATLAKVRGSLTRHINKMAAGAKADAPRDRPWLAVEGIHVDTAAGRLSRAMSSGPDPRGKPVALFVEFGTSRQPPQPFMYPQLDRYGPQLVADVERILGETFD